MKVQRTRRNPRALYALSAAAGIGLLSRHANAIISIDDFNFVNGELGAYTFYNQGLWGFDANVANIEAGLVWNGHETTTAINTVIPNSFLAGNGQVDMHATWVGQTIAGTGNFTYQVGMAPGANLWTGAVATDWQSQGTGAYSGSFDVSDASFATPYIEAMVTGVNGQTADVINSSWQGSQGINGNHPYDRAIDALLAQSGKTMVVAAGNQGPSDFIGFPASANNVIVVGATTGDTTVPVYSSVASFSDTSPSDFFVPTSPDGSTGKTHFVSRAVVDIVAPGTDLALAHYGGATGGNAFGGATDGHTDFYNVGLSGTSFSSPIVAGSAALIVNAGKFNYGGDPRAIDGRVVKAVLMNSASKLAGWDNGQQIVNGVITTKQALDWAQGTGQVNLATAYTQYTGGTTDLATSGGMVQPIGWAYGTITHNPSAETDRDYVINTPLNINEVVSVTLDWFSNDNFDTSNLNTLITSYGSFDNLDLQVWQTDAGGLPQSLIAQSISPYNSAEHLYFTLPSNGDYLIRVLEKNYIYNFTGATSTDYGLAWSVVPEPSASGFLLILSLGGLSLRRRSHRPTTA
ncbi:MAG: S8 family peptidase [Planctomycetota bacterium]|nr:S8 family peptidase [Planctomycetota bacterium]